MSRALFFAVLLAGCGAAPETEPSTTATSCADCAELARQGESCCGGVCQDRECVACGPKTPFLASSTCFEPTCCAASKEVLEHACGLYPLMPHPVVCSEAPELGAGPGGQHCVSMDYQPRCAWDEGGIFIAFCCEEGSE